MAEVTHQPEVITMQARATMCVFLPKSQHAAMFSPFPGYFGLAIAGAKESDSLDGSSSSCFQVQVAMLAQGVLCWHLHPAR